MLFVVCPAVNCKGTVHQMISAENISFSYGVDGFNIPISIEILFLFIFFILIIK